MILPMFVMFVWIWVIIFYGLVHRIKAVKTRQLHPSYFKTFTGEGVPDHILRINRHISNLFEMPPIFLLTGVLIIVLHLESPLQIYLAWGFVAARVVHSFIHLGNNHVIMRLSAFGLSGLPLLAMWINILLSQI